MTGGGGGRALQASDSPAPSASPASPAPAALPSGTYVNGTWAGFSWAFSETDPMCGPGLYTLTSLTVPLSLASGADTPATNVTFDVALFRADEVLGLPTTVIDVETTVAELTGVPAWVKLAAPFVIDISNGERAFAVVFSARGVSVARQVEVPPLLAR